MKLHSGHITVFLCLLLAACNNADVKESLGLNRKAPDEFSVVSRPALSVPPEFNLRPPTQGPEYSSGLPAQEQAHNKLLNSSNSSAAANSPFINPTLSSAAATAPVSTSALPNSADSQFLSDIGANKADPHIRHELEEDHEAGLGPKDNTYLLGNSKSTDPIVDTTKEGQRIKDDKAQNKPITTGDTPVITPKDKGILGDIF